ncbi:hypothetical protein [Coraliomargarita parva]|uniref:hypothetical protein n=1 Tax=Coraliomargarita parva TaxID=3014050 RepID=UPI0022B2AF27|nr:hypothetical protein [Coraliomargarita parva]
MNYPTKKVLFVPVTSSKGMGEFMRSYAVAEELLQRHPDWDLRFVLSKQAEYRTSCKLPFFDVSRSPTRLDDELYAVIDEFEPELVVFDNAGLLKHFRYAYLRGSLVSYISPFPHKRAKMLKLARLPYVAKHWVALPEFMAGEFSMIEKIKTRVYPRCRPEHVGVVYRSPRKSEQQALLNSIGVEAGKFVLLSGGSGGHFAGARPVTEVLMDVARKLAATRGSDCVIILGENYKGEVCGAPGVKVLRSLQNQDFISLMEAAECAVLCGGDTLLQALSLRKPVVAIPVAKDQYPRIRRLTSVGLVRTCNPDPDLIMEQMIRLLKPAEHSALLERMDEFQIRNGLEAIVAGIESLLIASAGPLPSGLAEAEGR